mmetsp:Transcript_26317/g.75906  ORF Transcript_26317/g.75906 Transcript_26317/m.75906 type:complete len:104 (-) Transcript_26317:54-365(-)
MMQPLVGSSMHPSGTTSRGNQFHTKCICAGCGVSDQLCAPAIAADVRCCCFSGSLSVNPSQCQTTGDLCAAWMGCRFLPFVVDVTNPLVDRDELVVVFDKKLA